MEYRTLGRTGLKVSVLGFGALEIGRNWPYWRQEMDDFTRPDESRSVALLHEAVDKGVNFFDTAPAYQDSEKIIGKAFKGMRKDVIIGTKCGEWFDGKNSVYNYSYDETKKFIENSLRLLQTDYIDLLQIHSANADVIRSGETLRAMKEARQSGKTRFIGLSTDDVETALLSIHSGDYDTIQVSYNAINLQFGRKVFPDAQKNNIGVIVKDGMARGKMTVKYKDVTDRSEQENLAVIDALAKKYSMELSELAMRFCITNPAVASVIIGTKKREHFLSNVSAAENGKLSDDLHSALMELNTNV
jgi:aryl-alcohol dehydrogenase-like predicted oxidoreductase